MKLLFTDASVSKQLPAGSGEAIAEAIELNKYKNVVHHPISLHYFF